MDNKKRSVLFALSTCPACKKTKDFLTKNNIDYLLVELDLLDLNSRDKMLEEVKKYNPKETFPTFVLDGGEKVVVGYNEERLNDTLNISSQP